MATIFYRRLDNNHDPVYGQGKANFLTDADAVAQAIETRLLLFQGEWWEDALEGLPLWQEMLGQPGGRNRVERITLLIQQRILGTPYVRSITKIADIYNPNTRMYAFYAEVMTDFGLVVVSNVPEQAVNGRLEGGVS